MYYNRPIATASISGAGLELLKMQLKGDTVMCEYGSCKFEELAVKDGGITGSYTLNFQMLGVEAEQTYDFFFISNQVHSGHPKQA